MAEVGHHSAVQVTVGRVGDRLVEGVGAHSDGTPTQVVLADVDRVEGGVEGFGATMQDVGLGDRVIAQRVIGHIVLRVHHILDQVIPLVLGVGDEEDVLLAFWGAGDLAEGGDHPGHVGVADVVLLAVGGPAAVAGGKDHVGLIDVGAVGLFGQAEGEHFAGLEPRGGLALGVLVGAHPDRAQA